MRALFEDFVGFPEFRGFHWNPPTRELEDNHLQAVFEGFGNLPTNYTHELTDSYYRYDPCPGAKLKNEINEVIGLPQRFSWVMDPTQLPPPLQEIHVDGKRINRALIAASSPGDLQVLGIEIIGNGDAEKDDDYGGWFNEQKWGNIALLISPGSCSDRSPPIPAIGSDKFRLGLAQLANEQNRVGYDSRNTNSVPSSIVVKARLPGPYRSVYPFPISPIFLSPKCEFGLLWQSVDYDPPLPVLNLADSDLPFHGNEELCLRLVEDDRDEDTALLQFTLNLAEHMEAGGTLVYAHHTGSPDSILSGPHFTQPSLVKIALSILQ